MKIEYIETLYKTVNLPKEAVYQVTKNALERIISPGEYLRTKNDGKVYLMQDDPHHRHGSISEEIVREATELDKAVILVLASLDKK